VFYLPLNLVVTNNTNRQAEIVKNTFVNNTISTKLFQIITYLYLKLANYSHATTKTAQIPKSYSRIFPKHSRQHALRRWMFQRIQEKWHKPMPVKPRIVSQGY